MGCDRCNQPATVHIKEISGGAVRELHLCEKCAAAQGMVAQKHATFFESVNALIVGKTADDIKDLKCEHCGMTWKEFKDTGLLGCVADYDIFAMQLTAWIESAQAGGNHHTGKIPAARATHGPDYLQAKERLLRMKAELSQAVSDEDFHHAAELRDMIKAMESQAGS